LAGSLSLFLPGSGQLIMGETMWSLFYVSTIAFLATAGWAVVSMFDRLTQTLPLLGIGPRAAVWSLGVIWGTAALIHVCGVVHAHRLGAPSLLPRSPHPFLAGSASLLVPGWGQLLNGSPLRAALFLAALWTGLPVWLSGSRPVAPLLADAGIGPPTPVGRGWGWIALMVVSAVIWAIAVYDAASGAAADHRD
jgi:TM2 domain-containing membrane protein YozV